MDGWWWHRCSIPRRGLFEMDREGDAMTADPSALAAGLRRAVVTASNDDWSRVGTSERLRHKERIAAMEAAAAFLEQQKLMAAAPRLRDALRAVIASSEGLSTHGLEVLREKDAAAILAARLLLAELDAPAPLSRAEEPDA